jgi:O-antigen/teichoic acid export membrane protein
MAIADSPKSSLAADERTHDLLRAHGPESSPVRSVAKGALALLSTQPLTWATSILAIVFVPRYLGDVALGQWTIGMTLSVLAGPVVSLGLLEYLSRGLASRSKDAAREARLAWVLMTVAACVAAAFLGLVAALTNLQVGSGVVLFAALGMIVITPTQGLLLTLLRGQERMRRFAAVSSLSAAAASLLPIGILVAGGGLNGFALSSLLVNVVALAVSWRTSGIRLPRVRISMQQVLALLPVGLPFFGWNLTMQFYGQIDRILIGFLAPVQVVGWYAAAVRIIGIPIFVPMLIVIPLFPALTRCRGDSAVFRHTLNTSLRAALLTTAPFCAATAAAAPAIPRFLGWPAEFDAASLPMTILAPNLTLVAVDMMLGTALLALGFERKWLIVGILAAVVNPSLNLLAIPYAQTAWGNGGIGAAAVTVITELVMLGGALVLVPRGLVDRAFLTTAVGTILAGAMFVAITRQLLAVSLTLPVALVPGGLAFLAGILVFRAVSPAELSQARHYSQRLIRSKLGRSALDRAQS